MGHSWGLIRALACFFARWGGDLCALAVADPRGGMGGLCPPPPFLIFFLQKRILLAKLVLNEHKICLKMLEMAILETQIFKNFWGSMLPDPLRKLAPSALVSAPPPPPFCKSWIGLCISAFGFPAGVGD